MAQMYNSNYDTTMPFSDVCAQFNLDANTELTFTVPGNATQKYVAVFQYASNSNVFVRLNATATSPAAGTSTTQQYSEMKPMRRFVSGGDVIHAVSPDTSGAFLSVCLYSI